MCLSERAGRGDSTAVRLGVGVANHLLARGVERPRRGASLTSGWGCNGVTMAKTKAERTRSRETLPWRQAEPALALADSGSIESDLAMDVGGAERYGTRPRYRAEDLIYEAWEAAGKRRVVLARPALALWPDCADAYVLLG